MILGSLDSLFLHFTHQPDFCGSGDVNVWMPAEAFPVHTLPLTITISLSETSCTVRPFPQSDWHSISPQSTDDFLDRFKHVNAWYRKAIKTRFNKKHRRAEGEKQKWCVCACMKAGYQEQRLTVAYASSYTTTCGRPFESWCRPKLCNSFCS